MIRRYYLPRGFSGFYSLEDEELILRHDWRVNIDVKGNAYACRYEGRKRVYMHREITGCPPRLVVDHINGNKLDNRRSNLRVCTQKMNMQNVITTGLLGLKGVTRSSVNRYRARIVCADETELHLGNFTTPEAAARAYDEAALLLYGEYAWLNYPIPRKELEDDDYEIPF